MPTIQVARPRANPISRTYAKLHARITSDDEDALVDSWIRSATRQVESATWRQLVCATYAYEFDSFPISRGFRFPRNPVRAVSSIQYVDQSAVVQTLAPSTYRFVSRGDNLPSFVEVADGYTWPLTWDPSSGVRVTFIAGHATPCHLDMESSTLSAPAHHYVESDPVQLWTLDGKLPPELNAVDTFYARDVIAGVSMKLAATVGGAPISFTENSSGDVFLGQIPEELCQAIAMLVRHADQNREPVVIGTISSDLPLGVDSLLSAYKLSQVL